MTRATATSGAEALRVRMGSRMEAILPEHIERLGWDEARLAAHQRDRLRALLARAAERSPFHRERLRDAGADPGTFELEDLSRLPAMTKDDLMENFGEIATDRRLTRELVEEHLAASAREPSLLLDEYVCLASGGSSGTRGVFVQTVEEYVEFGATNVRRAMARLAALGGHELTIGLVAAAAPVHSTGFAAATVGEGPIQAVSVPVTLPLAEQVERLNALNPPALMGYPSRLAELAAERRAGRLRISPFAISATSEMLTPEDREAIESGFGVPLVNQFASTEGLVGHSEPGEAELTFATDTCLAEPVDAAGRPVPHGTPSDRVLVTNLHNLTLPLIRFELTDRFVTCPPAAGSGYLRATVEGRSDEVFRYGDLEVHPLTFRTVLVSAPEVREYRVRQTERGAEVTVVGSAPDSEALATRLADGLRAAGLPDPLVTVDVAERIERHPQTGKVRRFVGL